MGVRNGPMTIEAIKNMQRRGTWSSGLPPSFHQVPTCVLLSHRMTALALVEKDKAQSINTMLKLTVYYSSIFSLFTLLSSTCKKINHVSPSEPPLALYTPTSRGSVYKNRCDPARLCVFLLLGLELVKTLGTFLDPT